MSKKGYRTPKGVDEGRAVTPDRFKERYEEIGATTRVYGHTLWGRGGTLGTKIIDEILRMRRNNESVVIVVTGPPGKGKTYFCLRFAQKLDKLFHIRDTPAPPPNKDDSQLAFGRDHLSHITGSNSPIKRDQVIGMDEAHFGIGARSWQNADQQELTNYIAAIRSKGYVLMIIALHTEMVDKIVRNFVLNYEFYVTKRGEGIIYRRFFPQHATKPYRKRLGKMRLMLPDEELCNYGSCLRCNWLNQTPDLRCETIRAVYERRKEEFLSKQAEKKEEEKTKKGVLLPQVVIELEPLASDLPTRGKGKNTHVNQSRLKDFILETLGHDIPERRMSSLAGDIEKTEWFQAMYT